MTKKKSILKDKPKLNICIDIVLFLLLPVIAGIGLLIKYVLIPGENRNLLYSDDINLLFWGLDRHEWGTIHLIISLVFIFFLVLHIVFHWKIILCLLRRLIPNKKRRIAFNLLISTLGILFLFFAFLIIPTQVYHEHNYRNRAKSASPFVGEQELAPTPDTSHEVVPKQKLQTTETKHNKEKIHQQKNRTIAEEYEVQGTYTLNYVADKYNVPCSYLCNELNIPQNLSSKRLGHLRRRYNFTMADVSKAIANHKKQNPQ